MNVDLALRFEPSAIQWSIWFNELMKTILSFITLVMHWFILELIVCSLFTDFFKLMKKDWKYSSQLLNNDRSENGHYMWTFQHQFPTLFCILLWRKATAIKVHCMSSIQNSLIEENTVLDSKIFCHKTDTISNYRVTDQSLLQRPVWEVKTSVIYTYIFLA